MTRGWVLSSEDHSCDLLVPSRPLLLKVSQSAQTAGNKHPKLQPLESIADSNHGFSLSPLLPPPPPPAVCDVNEFVCLYCVIAQM